VFVDRAVRISSRRAPCAVLRELAELVDDDVVWRDNGASSSSTFLLIVDVSGSSWVAVAPATGSSCTERPFACALCKISSYVGSRPWRS
jgi:hypothetical protein